MVGDHFCCACGQNLVDALPPERDVSVSRSNLASSFSQSRNLVIAVLVLAGAAILIVGGYQTVQRGGGATLGTVSVQGGPNIDLSDPETAAKLPKPKGYGVNVLQFSWMDVHALPSSTSPVVTHLYGGMIVHGSRIAAMPDDSRWVAVCDEKRVCGWANMEKLTESDSDIDWW